MRIAFVTSQLQSECIYNIRNILMHNYAMSHAQFRRPMFIMNMTVVINGMISIVPLSHLCPIRLSVHREGLNPHVPSQNSSALTTAPPCNPLFEQIFGQLIDQLPLSFQPLSFSTQFTLAFIYTSRCNPLINPSFYHANTQSNHHAFMQPRHQLIMQSS